MIVYIYEIKVDSQLIVDAFSDKHATVHCSLFVVQKLNGSH